jgi:hypothetical protein
MWTKAHIMWTMPFQYRRFRLHRVAYEIRHQEQRRRNSLYGNAVPKKYGKTIDLIRLPCESGTLFTRYPSAIFQQVDEFPVSVQVHGECSRVPCKSSLRTRIWSTPPLVGPNQYIYSCRSNLLCGNLGPDRS